MGVACVSGTPLGGGAHSQNARPNAVCALPVGQLAFGAELALKDDLLLSRAVRVLPEIVVELSASWIDGLDRGMRRINPICELPSAELLGVATELSEGFSSFSQFLCGLEFLCCSSLMTAPELEPRLAGMG